MLQELKYRGAWIGWVPRAAAHLILPGLWAAGVYFVVATALSFVIAPSWAMIAGLIAGAISGWSYLELPEFPQRPIVEFFQRWEGIFGTAGWAKREEVIAQEIMTTADNACILGEYREHYVPVGTEPINTGEQIAYTGIQGLVTIGPAGTGKGTSAIGPTLLSSHENMFVLDVKSGENFYISHAWRQSIGHDCIAFDPLDILDHNEVVQFNPLQGCIWRDGKPPVNFEKNLQDIGEAMITTGDNKNEFWGDSARDLFTCIAGHLCMTAGNRATLGNVREVLGYDPAARDAFLQHCYASTVPIIKNSAMRYATKGTDEKTVSSIIQTAISQMNYLAIPGVQERLATSTFSFEDLRRKKMTIYLVMSPRDVEKYHRLARLLVQCFMSAMLVMPKPHEHSVLAILDEQAQLGYLKSLEGGAATLRSYRVRLWSFFQNIGQLYGVYGKEGADTFLANAGIQQFFTTNDVETSKYVSEKIGTCTMPVESTSQTTGTGPGGRTEGTSSNWTLQAVTFFKPQDMYGLHKNRNITFSAGLAFPMALNKKYYLSDAVLKQRAGHNPFYKRTWTGKPKKKKTTPDWWPF